MGISLLRAIQFSFLLSWYLYFCNFLFPCGLKCALIIQQSMLTDWVNKLNFYTYVLFYQLLGRFGLVKHEVLHFLVKLLHLMMWRTICVAPINKNVTLIKMKISNHRTENIASMRVMYSFSICFKFCCSFFNLQVISWSFSLYLSLFLFKIY